MSEFPLHPNAPEMVRIEAEELQRLRDRIAELEKEAQVLRGSDARASMYLSIATDRLDAGAGYEGGMFDCDYEHPIHERITAICRENARLSAENQRLRADAERLIDGLVEMEREGALDGCFMHGPEGMLDGQACVWSFIGERIQDYHKQLERARGVKADEVGGGK